MAGRDERDITVIESDSGSVKWFVYGALLGAGLGLLFAPKAGAETRSDLSKHARRLRSEASERLDELTDEVEARGRQLKGRVEDWADEVAGEVRDGKREVRRAASSARDDLERRLADARMRRRAGVAADGVADLDDDDEDFEDEHANGDRIG